MSADGELQAPVLDSRRHSKRRVLFVAENVSLAQVVRLRVLASSLDPQRYEIVFACSEHDPLIFDGTGFERRILPSIGAEHMHRRIAWGRRLYSMRTLSKYVRDDLALIEEVEPDLIVGDLRLSLAVSAPKLRVPYAALINAYWSPHARRDCFPLPVHPIVRMIGEGRVAPHVGKAMPYVLAHIASPVNALRKRYGLPVIGDLLEVLTSADHTLFPDVPELVPMARMPEQHSFIGPVLWSPAVPMPRALDVIDSDESGTPLVYVTLGSSGDVRLIDAVLTALSRLPVRVLLATAGRFERSHLPPNVTAARYVPGNEAARRAALVICNGGSSTGYQALYEGAPVLGLPFNFDQSLAMQAIERAGAGLALRPEQASPDALVFTIVKLLTDTRYKRAAEALSVALRRVDAPTQFRALVHRAVDGVTERARAVERMLEAHA